MSTLGPIMLPAGMNGWQISLVNAMNYYIGVLKAILNHGIQFSENFDCALVTLVSSGTPDAENTVAHSLKKVPTGYLVYSRDKAAILYNGTTSWTSTNIYLKCNVASTTFKIIVF